MVAFPRLRAKRVKVLWVLHVAESICCRYPDTFLPRDCDQGEPKPGFLGA
jgi:hypothetical protein